MPVGTVINSRTLFFRISVTFFLSLIFNVFPVSAGVDISSGSDQALYQILNLRTNSAQHLIDSIRVLQKDSLYLEYLENWKQVIELIMHENEDNYKVFKESYDKRMIRINSNQKNHDPSYYILLAEINGQAGMANIMYGDYMSGFRKILSANNYLKKNQKLHPDYWLNLKLGGVLSVSFDKMPSVLKWFTSLLGLEGDTQKGMDQMKRYLAAVQDYPGLKSEALLYLTFAMKLSKDEESAYDILKHELADASAPTLVKYLHANIMYLTSHNDEALTLLFSFPDDYTEIPFYHLDYLKGKAKMNRLDEDSDEYMIRFIEGSNFKNYKREMYIKLAYYHLINNQPDKYEFYIKQIEHCAKATTDRDREATIESERQYPPHPELLKARFLVNGGYYQRSEKVLDIIDEASLDLDPYRAEYYLLKAKVYAGLHNYKMAEKFSILCMDVGKNLNEHYATEAALLAGDLTYEVGNSEIARNYWESTFKVYGKKDIYVENIHKKAKNHLKRTTSS